MSTPDRRGRRRNPRGSGDQLRSDLVAAAARLLHEHGDAAKVTLRGVAAAVGVAPTAVYLHFADRDELMLAVIEQEFAEFHAAIEDADDPEDARVDPLAALTRRGVAYVRFAMSHPGTYRLMFSRVWTGPGRPELVARYAAAASPSYRSLVAAVERTVDAGAVAGDPAILANVVWCVVHGYADLAAVGVPFLQPPEELVGAFTAALAAGAVSGGRRAATAPPEPAR